MSNCSSCHILLPLCENQNFSAYGKVYLVRKVGGFDNGRIYAMKVLRKSRVAQKPKTLQHTIAERNVLEHIRKSHFLVNLQYAFQTDSKLNLVMGKRKINTGVLFHKGLGI